MLDDAHDEGRGNAHTEPVAPVGRENRPAAGTRVLDQDGGGRRIVLSVELPRNVGVQRGTGGARLALDGDVRTTLVGADYPVAT